MTNNNRSRRGLGRTLAAGVMATILVIALPLSAMAVHLTGVTQLEPVGDDDNVGVALAWSNPAGFPTGGLASGARDPEYVLIGRDDIFPDNLASGALQGAPGPLLLTPSDELDDRVIAEIERLGVDRAIILGGTNAISEDVETALGDEVGTVDRLAGATRIETAIEVTRESGATTVLLARAFDADGGSTSAAFADSLAGGGWAAAEGYGVLLTQTETLTQSTADFLSEGDVDQVIILGGTAAVSQETEDAVAAIVADTTRVFGDNRAGTAVEIAEARGFNAAADAPGNILVDGFTEDAWASGFAAAATSALEDYPIVLSNGDDLPPETEAYASAEASPAFAQANPDSNVVCGPRTTEAACLAFAALVGTIDLTVDQTSLAAGDDLTGSVNVSDDDFDVTVSGCGLTDEPVAIDDDGNFTVPDFPGTADDDGDPDTDDTTCVLTFTFTNADGDTFTRTVTVTITESPTPATDVLIPLTARVANSTPTQLLLEVTFNNEISAGGLASLACFAYGPTRAFDASAGGFGAGQASQSGPTTARFLYDIPAEFQPFITTLGCGEGAGETPTAFDSALADVPVQTAAGSVPSGRTAGPDGVSAGNFDDDGDPANNGTEEVEATLDEDVDDASLVNVAGNAFLYAANGSLIATATGANTGATPNDEIIEVEFGISNADFANVRALTFNDGVLDDTDMTFLGPFSNPAFSLPLNGGTFASDVPRITNVVVDYVNQMVEVTYNQSVTPVAFANNEAFDYEQTGPYVPSGVVLPQTAPNRVVYDYTGGSFIPEDTTSFFQDFNAVIANTTGTPNVPQSFPIAQASLNFPPGYGAGGPLVVDVAREEAVDIFGDPTGVEFTLTLDQPLTAVVAPVVTVYGPAEDDANDVTCDDVDDGDTEVICGVLSSTTNFDAISTATYVGVQYSEFGGQFTGYPNIEMGEFVS